jgi:hypothetical protein
VAAGEPGELDAQPLSDDNAHTVQEPVVCIGAGGHHDPDAVAADPAQVRLVAEERPHLARHQILPAAAQPLQPIEQRSGPDNLPGIEASVLEHANGLARRNRTFVRERRRRPWWLTTRPRISAGRCALIWPAHHVVSVPAIMGVRATMASAARIFQPVA